MQRWFNICKSINVIQYINRSKDKTHLIISIDAESLQQDPTPLYDKSSKKTRREGKYLNIVKAIHDKYTANIILNGENLKPFPKK
jgi:hypothetical protein